MFGGYVVLDASYVGTLLVVDTSNTPINADALPSYRVYGPMGFVKEGTTSLKDSGSITDASNASPIAIASTGHGLTTGSLITIAGVTGNTSANGTFNVTRVDSNSYTLDGSTGNGAYAGGGTWNVTGLYGFTIAATGVDGYESGESYQIQFTYEISATETGQLQSFQVN